MATYEYCCDDDGPFDLSRPMGTAPPTAPCPRCGVQARRLVSAPLVLRSSRSAWSAAIERADRSRYEPEVVASPPPVASRRVSGQALLDRNPALRGLPRP